MQSNFSILVVKGTSMKKLFVIVVLVLALGAGLATAGPAEFSKGNFFLTPQVGFASWGGGVFPFGVNAEYAVSENVGLGGSVMYQGWTEELGSVSLISFAFQANYHFIKLDASKFDLYAGAELGYGLYNITYDSGFSSGISGSSGFILAPVVGGRYFLSPTIALSLRLTGSLVLRPGFGATVGVSFKL
jgi:hypothetical protein